ncbi:ABC transporter permease [Marmoricola endophyticus]|uniref:ABC transporter permease n=1 Tax=Marmoricola endophyticus TaxID=2040280 RepID=A0A917F788_9ACTN|nr:ABC transporter ATP-binding protein [Marmoricola endophyticus]GGF55046.1 ABC transporter permease [Marmoricola endophyticus]
MSARELLPTATGRDTARLAWTLVRRRPGAVWLTLLAFVGAGAAGVVPVWLIGQVVDAAFGEDASTGTVVRAALGIAVSAVVWGALTAVAIAALTRAVAPALATLREDVLDRALHLPSQRVEAAGVGDVVARVGDDVRTLTESLDEAVPALLTALVTIVFTVGGLFGLDWRLGVAGLASAPAYVLAVRWYLPLSLPWYQRERIAEGERAQALVTGMQGAATLRAFGREDRALAAIDRSSRGAVEITVGVYRLLTRFGARLNGSELLGLTAVLLAGFWTVRAGGTVGEATAAALFFHRLFNPIGAVVHTFDTVQSSGAALARLAGVAGLPVAPAPAQAPAEGDLTLAGLRHAYEPGHDVLADVSLVLAAGERVAVVGATGAGKSTLGAVVAGAVSPTAGRVHLGAWELTAAAEADVRRRVALVTQEVHVFAGSVRDNLGLAAPDAPDDALLEALDRVGARRWVGALPTGLDTVVGEHGHPLTAAQAQQLALARVLLRDPVLVVLDEATAEAGSAGARDLDAATDAVVAGRTALVVAHRLDQARAADRVLVMEAGRVVEQGPHDDLLTAGGRYAALWAAWSR